MIRMSDIAVRAGVSRATVSFVLNGKHQSIGISEETRLRVMQAARDLGYRRNEAARQMVTGRSSQLGFVTGHAESEVSGRILTGALEAAFEEGLSLKVLGIDNFQDSSSAIARLSELRLAGVMTHYVHNEAFWTLEAEMARCGDVPIIVLDSLYTETNSQLIVSDDEGGGRAVVEHLVELGHRRIVYISGAEGSSSSLSRGIGFRSALAEHGLPAGDDMTVLGDWDPVTIKKAVIDLYRNRETAPTALFCADDRTGLVALRTLRSIGLSIPRDVSVVGFADLSMAALADPPLTTVAQPFREIGRTAVRMLVSNMSPGRSPEEALPSRKVVLPTRLIIRESTAPAPAARGASLQR